MRGLKALGSLVDTVEVEGRAMRGLEASGVGQGIEVEGWATQRLEVSGPGVSASVHIFQQGRFGLNDS